MIKKLAFLCLFSVLLVAACGEQQEEQKIAEGVMSKENFTEVLTDVQLLEASMRQRFIRDEDPKLLYPIYYKQIFEKHEISEEEFKESLEYWSGQDEEMTGIYDNVIENLSLMSDPDSVNADTDSVKVDQ
ncbi:DUF4296 domain-containing protein [Halocola ammonii]